MMWLNNDDNDLKYSIFEILLKSIQIKLFLDETMIIYQYWCLNYILILRKPKDIKYWRHGEKN